MFVLALVASMLLLGSQPALADHPEPHEMERVREVAHRLERRADRLHELARERAHHGGRREERAVRAVGRFARDAHHFHEQVERFRQDPAHTEADFDRLYDGYVHARAHLGDLHPTNAVWEAWERADDAFGDLARYYRFDVDRNVPWHRRPVPWWGPPWRRW